MLTRARSFTIALIALSALGLGCVGGSKANKASTEELKQYVLASAPADITRLDADFEGKAKLVGYKLTPTQATAGAEVKLTMYWECTGDVGDGWNLFTHVLDSAGERVLNVDNVGPLRNWLDTHQALAPSFWEKGKVYVDEQTFSLPDPLNTPEVTIVTGIWKNDTRLKILSGPHDQENRAIVAHMKTAQAAPKPVANTLKLMRSSQLDKNDKIKIDGKLDEDAWKKAASTGPFVNVTNGQADNGFPVQGSARVAWDDKNLYVGFEVRSKTVIGGWPKGAKDPHLWEKDTVEIMIDPDGDGDNVDYYEIQINPQNLIFDTQYDKYNEPKDDAKGVFGHMDWTSKAQTAVVVDGDLDKENGAKGYTVEAAIPWASFTKAKTVPPKPGDTWRLNFYAMKNNSGVAWSPIMGEGNFHKASRFGKISWVLAGDNAPAGSAPAAASSVAPALSAPVKLKLGGVPSIKK